MAKTKTKTKSKAPNRAHKNPEPREKPVPKHGQLGDAIIKLLQENPDGDNI